MSEIHRDPETARLLSEFQERQRKWAALAQPCQEKLDDANGAYREIDERTDAKRARIKRWDALAGICTKALGVGEKSLQMRLMQAGLPTDLAELYEQNRNLAHAIKNPRESMPGCPILRDERWLREFEKLLAKGKYADAQDLLKSNEPGWLSRTFSPDRAAAKTREIEALRTYAGHHEELRARFKTLEKILPEVEYDAAVALYKILKSKEWKALSAGPLPEALENDPAIQLLRKHSGDLERGGMFKGLRLCKALQNDIENLYIDTGKTINPKTLENLFRGAEGSENQELQALRAERAVAGKSRKEAGFLARRTDSAMERELFATIRGHKVDLVAALEKVNRTSGMDPVERRELLVAARNAQKNWSDKKADFIGQGLESGVSQGAFAKTGRFLSDCFNLAASGTEKITNAIIRKVDSVLLGNPTPAYL